LDAKGSLRETNIDGMYKHSKLDAKGSLRETNIDGMYKHSKLDYLPKVIDKDKGLTLMKPSRR
jgi:hypothetical protein